MERLVVHIIMLYWTLFYCEGDSDFIQENENKVLKFRVDMDQIGVDLENFFYDLLTEALNNYGKIEKSYSKHKEDSTPTQTTNNKLHDFVQQYNSQLLPLKLNPTGTTTSSQNVLDHYLDNYIENHSPSLKNKRRKRASDSRDIIINQQEPLSNCSQKTQREHYLEHMHIEELKDEIGKLKDLILLLRSQQKTILSLDELINENLTNNNQTKKMLNAWKNINPSDLSDSENSKFPSELQEHKNPVHEELANLKNDLHQTISLLNTTRAFLVEEQQQGMSLKNEMKSLNKELGEMKIMIEKMYQLNNISSPESHFNTILGKPLHLPKSLPVEIMKSRENMDITTKEHNDEVNTKVRSSRLDKLLKELDRPKDISTEINKLQQELKRSKDQENMKKILQKLLNKDDKLSGRNLLSDELDTSIQWQKILKTINNSPTQTDDDEVENDLKQLAQVINSLQSHDLDSKSPKDSRIEDLMKLLLVDILDRNVDKGKQHSDNLPSIGSVSLTAQQIADLRKRLEQLANNGKCHFPSLCTKLYIDSVFT